MVCSPGNIRGKFGRKNAISNYRNFLARATFRDTEKIGPCVLCPPQNFYTVVQPDLIKTSSAQTARVSLNDCLACRFADPMRALAQGVQTISHCHNACKQFLHGVEAWVGSPCAHDETNILLQCVPAMRKLVVCWLIYQPVFPVTFWGNGQN